MHASLNGNMKWRIWVQIAGVNETLVEDDDRRVSKYFRQDTIDVKINSTISQYCIARGSLGWQIRHQLLIYLVAGQESGGLGLRQRGTLEVIDERMEWLKAYRT